MTTVATSWQRRLMATGVVGAAVLTPFLGATPANAASLCAPPADTVPPQITSLTFSRQSVDLEHGSRTVTVTADATDTSGNGAPSGVRSIDVDVSGSPNYVQTRLTLASGTAADGVWTGTITVPKDGRPGTWKLQYVSVEDHAGNAQYYSNNGAQAYAPTDIGLQSGWDKSITVTGVETPPPTKVKAGALTAFDLTPQAVDTTTVAKTVHVTARFSAPVPKQVTVFLSKASGQGRPLDRALKLKRGTAGQWSGTLTIPRWAGDSKARVQLFVHFARTDTPVFRNISPADLRGRGFPAALTITSRTDKTKPVLRSLTFSPSSVNTTTGAQTVTVTATASDTLSGVGQVQADLDISHGDKVPASGLYPYPGIGYDQGSYVSVTLKPSGNKWIGTATFRECVPSGTWHVAAYVNDKAENTTFYSSKKLVAAGLPGSLSVTSTPGDVEPPSVRDATASGADHTITIDFTEGVKNVDTTTLSVFALKPAATRFEHSTAVSGIVCSNGTATVDCSGSGGLVTSAVLTVPALVGGREFQVFGNLNAVTPQLTDGAGNPLDWNYSVADVTGS